MTLIVDIRDWLTKSGDLPTDNPRLRGNALRIANFIEYAADLDPSEGRETLLACRRKPRRRQCLGLIWVVKLPDDRIEAVCLDCHDVEAVISGWQDTVWADGFMPATPMQTVPGSDDPGGDGTSRGR